MASKIKTDDRIEQEIGRVVGDRTASAMRRPVAAGDDQIRLKDRHSGSDVWLTLRGGIVVGAMGSDPSRYMGLSMDEAKRHARYGGRPRPSKKINAEYSRKAKAAAEMADRAWLSGGLDAMDAELKSLRRSDADPVIIAEFERLYHNQMRRTLPGQRVY